jgi:hypothetical protein
MQLGLDTVGTVRIVREGVSPWGKRFWYTLEVVSGPVLPWSRLQSATDGCQPNPKRRGRVVDPIEEQVAIAKLRAWAQEHGWTIID